MKNTCNGQAISEYALGIALVAIISIGGLTLLGKNLSSDFNTMVPAKPAAAPSSGPGLQVTGGGSSSSGGSSQSGSGSGQSTTPPSITPSGAACFSSGQCLNSSITNYNPTQTAGANGINIVDSYADTIKKLAALAHADSKVNPDFAAMLDDLAADGHNVAGDERSVLTWSAGEGGMSFDIQNRYAQTKARAMNYLSAHPNEMTPGVAAILNTAANNITQQASDFAGGSNIASLNANNINQKFTNAAGTGKGATYVDQQASTVCATGGKTCTP